MRFMSWRKEESFTDHAHWPFSALLSLILAFISTYSFWLFEQKGEARKQLTDIDTLLSITTRDTAASLDAIQHQLGLLKQGSGPAAVEKISLYVSTINTMVQQITVLQRIATPDRLPVLQATNLIPLFIEVAEMYAEPLKMRDLSLALPSDPGPVMAKCNKWLMCHTVFGNILAYAIEKTNTESTIKIECFQEDKGARIIFAFKGQAFSPEVLKGYLEHGLYVAQKMVLIHNGQILFATTPEGMHNVILILPV